MIAESNDRLSHRLRRIFAWDKNEWTAKDEDCLLWDWSTTDLPWPIYRVANELCRWLFWLQSLILPASMTLANMSFTGFCLSEIIRTLAALDIAERLSLGPKTAEELAEEIGESCDAIRLSRLLRAATTHHLFAEIRIPGQPVQFRNNHVSATLRADHPNSQKYFVLGCTGKELAGSWGELEWGVRTGGDIFQRANAGIPSFWEMIKQDPLKEDIFSRAMAATEGFSARAIQRDFPWGKFNHLIDIGGAYGSGLSNIMSAYRHLTAVLFDQEKVIQRAKGVWNSNADSANLLNRIEFASGDFFDTATLPRPKGQSNAYIMRQILHDWNDKDCVRILKSLRQAMAGSDATLCIVEGLLTNGKTPTSDVFNRPRVLSDMHMMVQLNAQERDVAHMRFLLEMSGFRFKCLTQTRSLFSVLEAVPEPLETQTPSHLPAKSMNDRAPLMAAQ
eukprot:jgi/Botrbrau1/14689/Bobra.0108s0045.1